MAIAPNTAPAIAAAMPVSQPNSTPAVTARMPAAWQSQRDDGNMEGNEADEGERGVGADDRRERLIIQPHGAPGKIVVGQHGEQQEREGTD